MSGHNSMSDSNPLATFSVAAAQLNALGIAYLHVVEGLPGHRMFGEGERVTPHIRRLFKGALIANGGYTKPLANDALQSAQADAVSFGISFLANPDLVSRLRHDYPLNAPDMETLYAKGTLGYVDYPLYNPKAA